jgi:hypothetical protein
MGNAFLLKVARLTDVVLTLLLLTGREIQMEQERERERVQERRDCVSVCLGEEQQKQSVRVEGEESSREQERIQERSRALESRREVEREEEQRAESREDQPGHSDSESGERRAWSDTHRRCIDTHTESGRWQWT